MREDYERILKKHIGNELSAFEKKIFTTMNGRYIEATKKGAELLAQNSKLKQDLSEAYAAIRDLIERVESCYCGAAYLNGNICGRCRLEKRFESTIEKARNHE